VQKQKKFGCVRSGGKKKVVQFELLTLQFKQRGFELITSPGICQSARAGRNKTAENQIWFSAVSFFPFAYFVDLAFQSPYGIGGSISTA
jgi:hypothetical protein